MARFSYDFQTPYTPEQVNEFLNDFAQKEGFTFTSRDGEQVLKKGSGWVTAPQFVKVLFSPGTVHIEAWLKYALLPGVYVGEMGLKGFFGIALKQVLKTRVKNIIIGLGGQPPTDF
ncbi:MAG: hypothetical protein FWC54_04405 [Actinomycetia bacterium]|nr:hypothetical protein [Actinomycetes bacterium]